MTQTNTPHDHSSEPMAKPDRPLPILRSGVAGLLMGLANLVPGVSGGTMILVTGLYDEFIGSVADVTRLKFTRRNVLFLLIVGVAAVVAVVALAGTLSRAVTLYRSAMFALFLGLTLGGAPLLIRMINGFTTASLTGVLIGLAGMIAIAATKEEPPDQEAIRTKAAAGEFIIVHDYARDVAAGALGMSAMVLPGVSGAYMLLVLDRYEPILASIAVAKDYLMSAAKQEEPTVFLRVLIPTGIGAVISLVLLSNLLKWMLRRYEKPTLGLLLGILVGAVVGIWPFDAASRVGDYALGGLLAMAGFICTFTLSKLSR